MNHVAVAVIGGGAAGIAATRTLMTRGIDCVLLEASGRLGGRAHTVCPEGVPLDLGCHWLHSADRNPWVAHVAELGLTLATQPPPWRKQAGNLGFSPAEQAAAHKAFGEFYERVLADPASDRASDSLEPGNPWNPYIEAISGYMNGTGTASLSARDFAAYENAATDENWRVREGYGELVHRFAAGLPVRLNCPVRAIDLSSKRIRLETPQGTLEADKLIIATPPAMIGQLLPEKRDITDNITLGRAEKVFLALDDPTALPPDSQLLGNPHRAATGAYHLRPLGTPVIEGFFGGAGAEAIEADSDRDAYAFAIDELAALLGNDFRREVRPLALSRWSADPLIGGGYSHALPGHAAARAKLAEPIEGRVLFAGEATSATDFSTCHGAYQSGVIAASQI
jgi:monoamine oxidase